MTMENIKLEDVFSYEQPTRYIVHSSKYSEDTSRTAVLTAGKTFILGYTNEKDGIFPKEKLPVIIFDDFTTATKFVDFPFKVKSSAMKILHIKNNKKTDARYLFYLLQSIHFPITKHKRHWISEYSQITIDLPSISEQKKIAKKINKLISIIELKNEMITDLLLEQKSLFASLRSSILRREFQIKNK
jgi:type I restriction enzyme S subunit